MTNISNLKEEMTGYFFCFFKAKDGCLKCFQGNEIGTDPISDKDLERIMDVVADVFDKLYRQKEGDQILQVVKNKQR